MEWVVPEGASVVTETTDELELVFDTPGEYEIGLITTQGNCTAQKTKKILIVEKDASTIDEAEEVNKFVEDFMLYPNPTTGKFTADVTLSETGNISIKIFNFISNAVIASAKERGETFYSIPFDISVMPAGVYAVLLETPYGNSIQKIVVR